MDPIRRWGWIYFGALVLVVIVGYIPAFEDADGNLFGLFKLDLYDDALHLASGTVKNHLSSVFLKLGVRDRTRAVLRALELGLLEN